MSILTEEEKAKVIKLAQERFKLNEDISALEQQLEVLKKYQASFSLNVVLTAREIKRRKKMLSEIAIFPEEDLKHLSQKKH